MITPMTIPATAYSYARYSSGKQSTGNTLDRQLSAARAYADANGLVLDTTLTLHDLGVSGFTGRNLSPLGKLGKFIEAVDRGDIAPGSFLLIESFDRFSRLPTMEAFDKLREVTKKGIVVVTLMDGVAYSEESIGKNWTSLIIALASMERGNDESNTKSKRSIKNWTDKVNDARESLRPRGNTGPMWLDYIDGHYVINEQRATVVRQIYQWALDGYGRTLICQMLNERKIKSFKGTTWGSSSVQLLLTNQAVTGSYQPHSSARGEPRKPVGAPIIGYYPEIITVDLFDAVQDATRTRFITRAAKQSKSFNIWAGIGRCAKCHSTLHMTSKGTRTYLQCQSRRKGTCDAKSIRLEPAELVFREVLVKVGDKSLVQESSAKQRTLLQATESKLRAEQSKQTLSQSIYEEAPSLAVAKTLQKHEEAIATYQSEIAILSASLATDSIIDKDDFFAKLDTHTYEGRSRANSLLKRLNIRVYIVATGYVSYVVAQDEQPIVGFSDVGGTITALALNFEQLAKVQTQESPGNIGQAYFQLLVEKSLGKMDEQTFLSRLEALVVT